MAQPESIPAEANVAKAKVEEAKVEEVIENEVAAVREVEAVAAATDESPTPIEADPVAAPAAEPASAVDAPSESASGDAAKTPGKEPRNAAPPPAKSSGRGAIYLAAALAIGLLISGMALINQGREVLALQGEVETLTGELATAEAQVAAHEETIAQVRSDVSDIIGRMTSLQALVGGPLEEPAIAEPVTFDAAAVSGDSFVAPVVAEFAEPAERAVGEPTSADDMSSSGIEEVNGGAVVIERGSRPLDAFGDPAPVDPFVGEASRDDILLEIR